MAINIIAEPLILDFIQRGTITFSPPSCKDHRLDSTIDVDELGGLYVDFELGGEITSFPLNLGLLESSLDLYGNLVISQVITCDPLTLDLLLAPLSRYMPTAVPASAGFGGPVINIHRSNWIKWSKIGYADFTIDQSNVSGERPMSWSGYVYQIRKLGDMIVVYGSGGISVTEPKDVYWTERPLLSYGIACKTAMAGNLNFHYFIDTLYRLWKMTVEGPQLLGYQEYLSTLENPVVTFDEVRNLVYITDIKNGFVYSADTNSFSKSTYALTGIGFLNGQMLVVSPSELSVPIPTITTGTYDFGNRLYKTIHSISVGANYNITGNLLQMKVLYRTSNNQDFSETPFVRVNPNGTAYIQCYGIEFRFSLRAISYEDLRIDYLQISGSMSGYDQSLSYLGEG